MSNFRTDFEYSCRLCLSSGGIRIPIFEDESNDEVDMMLPSKILTCVSIKVEKEDPFPTWICQHCQTKIDDIYEFRRICSLSDARLKKNLNMLSSEEEDVYSDSCVDVIDNSAIPDNSLEETVTIRVKQEPDELSESFVIEDTNPLYVKDEVESDGEDNLAEESEQLDTTEDPSQTTYTYQTLIQPDSVKSDELQIAGETELFSTMEDPTQRTYPTLIKPDLAKTNGLEIQPIYRNQDEPPRILLVRGGRKRLRQSLSLECPICCCPFTYQAAFDKHRKICKKKMSKKSRQGARLLCPICQVECASVEQVWKHEQMHKRLKPRPVFQCDMCNVTFEKKSELICHEAQCHRLMSKVRPKVEIIVRPKEAAFSCDLCDIMFQHKGELICHQAQYHRAQVNKNIAQQKSFGCSQCGQMFTHKGEYILHKEFHHTASRLTCRLPIYKVVTQAANNSV